MCRQRITEVLCDPLAEDLLVLNIFYNYIRVKIIEPSET
jgi:hypothetical protein